MNTSINICQQKNILTMTSESKRIEINQIDTISAIKNEFENSAWNGIINNEASHNLVSGQYYLIEKDSRFPLELTGQWQSFSNKIVTPKYPSIYILSGHNNCYIGMDTYGERPREHKSEFNREVHSNKYMQNVYNKYGPENFYYQCIVQIPLDVTGYINIIENAYIKHFDTYNNGYNIHEFSNSTFGRIITEETRKKLSAAQKGNKKWLGKKHTEETRKKMSQASQSRRKNLSKQNAKKFIVIDPMGNIVEGFNLSQFAKANNLNESLLSRVINGKSFHHQGWRQYKKENLCQFQKEKIGKIFKVYSPDGIEYKGINITEFAKKNGLKKGSLHALISGKIKICKGWTLTNNKPKKREFIIRDPKGKIYKFINKADFARKHNLNPSSIYQVVTGKAKSHKGWTAVLSQRETMTVEEAYAIVRAHELLLAEIEVS